MRPCLTKTGFKYGGLIGGRAKETVQRGGGLCGHCDTVAVGRAGGAGGVADYQVAARHVELLVVRCWVDGCGCSDVIDWS